MIAGADVFSRWNRERDFRPLYSALGARRRRRRAGQGAGKRIRVPVVGNGTAVLVPSGRVAELRLQLAAAGLPKSGRIGFELFDKTNFGASDFTEQVNYHRALEGELERR